MILLFLTVMGAMGIAGAATEGALRQSPKATFLAKVIGWLSGTIAAPSLAVGSGWLLGGFSQDYWDHLAKDNFLWGLGLGALACAGVVQVVTQQHSDR